MVRATGLHKHFGALHVLRGVSLTVARGEIFLSEDESSLRRMPDLDIVIRGESELPIREIALGLPLSEIQGLTYRDGETIRRNPNRPLLEDMAGLRQSADVIVPRWDKFPEPLHAVYSKASLEPMREKLEAQMYKITAFYGRVSLRFVDRAEIERFDPDGRSFINVNTPEELAQRQARS